MAQSPEYPDLKWIPPRSWTNDDRTKNDIKFIVIHTTEGNAKDTAAENGANYSAERTDGTSAHYYIDSNSVVHCVRTQDRAHTARATGNRYGIQYELCGKSGWSASDWTESYPTAMLKLAAKQAARDAKKYDIPVRHLTVAQVRNKERGFCSHWDITRAFPEDNGSHTDPGPNFPWTRFLDLVRAELDPQEEDVPLTQKEIQQIADAVWSKALRNPYSDTDQAAGTILRYAPSRSPHEITQKKLDELEAQLAELRSLVVPPETPASE